MREILVQIMVEIYTKRCREANTKREFGSIRQFIREGGDGHVWGADKNIHPHRRRSRAWHDAWWVRYEFTSCQSGGYSGATAARISRGGWRGLEATTVRKGDEKVSV